MTGFCTATNPDRLKNLSRVPHKGDWRRSKLIRIQYKLADITWSNKDNNELMTITTPVGVVMSNLLTKLQSASGRNFETIPSTVVEYFKLVEKRHTSRKIMRLQLLLTVSFIV